MVREYTRIKVPLNVTIDVNDRTWLEEQAQADHRTLSNYVSLLIKRARDAADTA